MKRIKNKILIIFAILLIFAGQASAFSSVVINSVIIEPGQPLNTELITFNISGWATQRPSWVDHDVYTPNGTSLQLDLYVDMESLHAESNWTYSKQIQPLAIGTYSLEVRAFDGRVGHPFYNTLQDTYETVNFTVVPDPATLFLLGLGAIFAREKRI